MEFTSDTEDSEVKVLSYLCPFLALILKVLYNLSEPVASICKNENDKDAASELKVIKIM